MTGCSRIGGRLRQRFRCGRRGSCAVTLGSLALLRVHLNRGPAAQAQLAVGTADTPSVLPPGPRDRTRVYSEVPARASISIRERQPRYAAYVGCAVDVGIKAARVIAPRTQLLWASTVPAHGVLRRATPTGHGEPQRSGHAGTFTGDVQSLAVRGPGAGGRRRASGCRSPIRARVPRETPGWTAFGGGAIMTVVIRGRAREAGHGVVTIRVGGRFHVKRRHRLGRARWSSAPTSRTPAMSRQPAVSACETIRELGPTGPGMSVALPTRKSTSRVSSSSRAYAGRARHRRSLPTPSARVSRGLDDPCRVVDVSRGTWIRG